MTGDQIFNLIAGAIGGFTIVSLFKVFLDDRRKGINAKTGHGSDERCEQLARRLDDIEKIRQERAQLVDQRFERVEERLEAAITVIKRNRKKIAGIIDRFINKSY